MKTVFGFMQEIILGRSTSYQTRHRKALLSFLESAQGRHVAASDIHHHFRQLGMTIGISTIYRHLERMVDEGLVNQYLLDKADAACFEYVGPHVEDHTSPCFHLKCESCGKLIHVHCDELNQIHNHMRQKHGFDINTMRTVFYGQCDQCKNPSHR